MSGSHSRLFSGMIVIGTVNIIGILSDPVPIFTGVQHWLLATNRDRIAVGLSLSLYPCIKLALLFQLFIWLKCTNSTLRFALFALNSST